MRRQKDRLTVTIDRVLLQAANDAVAAGRAPSISSWVNRALAERVATEQRLLALGEALDRYQAKFGAFTADELVAQRRADRRAAIRVHVPETSPGRSPRRPRGRRAA